MTSPNTAASLASNLVALGLRSAMTVMVHSSLGRVGWTEGGPIAVIEALLDVLGQSGTLVMPAESPQLADPANTQLFDPQTTPTTMGAIPEAFRSYQGTLRSHHPLGSVCANGRFAREITAQHSTRSSSARAVAVHSRNSISWTRGRCCSE